MGLLQSMHMIIREITTADYNTLLPFWEKFHCVNAMDTKDRFELFLKKNPGLSILVEEEGRVIGTAMGSFDGRRGYINKLAIDDAYRHKGIGKTLVTNIVEKLKSLGATYIPVSVNKNTAHFYQSCGFKIAKQVSMYLAIGQPGQNNFGSQ
jgi:N-acetylglutamate synthase